MKRPRIALSSARNCCSCSPCSSRCRGSATNTCASWSACCAMRRNARSRAPRRRVATALHDRPRLFADPPDPIASFARDARRRPRGHAIAAAVRVSRDRADHRRPVADDRAHLGDRPRRNRARARGIAQAAGAAGAARVGLGAHRGARRSAGSTSGSWTSRRKNFDDDAATRGAPSGRDVEGALAGILTTDRRRRPTARR